MRLRIVLMVVLVSAIGFLGELLTTFSASCSAEVPEVGPEHCVANCPDESGGSGSYLAPAGPSPEELRQQREAEDLSEAALDANDRGVEAYENGDYAAAVQYLSEALDYAPDDPDIQHSLDRAREALRQSEAARQLKSVEYHSKTAKSLGGEAGVAQARLGFDTAGEDAGTLDIPAVNVSQGGDADPVVPPAQHTVMIRLMEWKREGLKQSIQRLEKQRQTLDPQKDAVQIAHIEQQQGNTTREIRKLNLGITEQLGRAPAPKSEPAQSAQER